MTGSAGADPPALEALGISKRFGRVLALDGVDIALRRGEVHAVLGENGAGKSTLMNVLYALVRPDGGEMRRSGRPVRFGSPADAIAAGIGMVHQHFALVPTFTVAENLALGRTRGRYSAREAGRAVVELGRRVGLDVDPSAITGSLPVGMQQRIEILKALGTDTEVLILDEPTGVLAPREIDDLLDLVRRLAEGGAAVAIITHKLAEVERIADTVTVLRQGRRITHGPASGFSAADLARAMVGTDPPQPPEEPGLRGGPPPKRVLDASDVTIEDERGRRVVGPLSLEVREGEVLGIAGVEGSGQTELAEAITGLRPTARGRLVLVDPEGHEEDLTRGDPRAFLDAGGAHIPEDRRRTGLVLAMPIWENLILESHCRPPIRRGPWLDRSAARRRAADSVRDYAIRAESVETPAGSLSGGNQQKVVIAREMGRDPRMLVAVNPTRGLDLRAAAYVHDRLREHRARGGAALLISSELDELRGLADRIAVIHSGAIVAVLARGASRDEIGVYMTRGAPDRVPVDLRVPGEA